MNDKSRVVFVQDETRQDIQALKDYIERQDKINENLLAAIIRIAEHLERIEKKQEWLDSLSMIRGRR